MGRYTATRIAIFNHKGGVGKTTLTMNIAAALAESGRRVLLVDADPQCNLTSYLLSSDVVDDLLDTSDTPGGRTIWSAVRPVSDASGDARVVEPVELSVSGLFLIPGDIRLSEFETDLSDLWGQSFQRKVKGFRGTCALSWVVNEAARDLGVDYVFYDSGPNIGPLNRVVLLDVDCFVVPVACDLFSLRALKTLGRTLVDWIINWQTIASLAPEDMYLLPGRPRFIGYIAEGFKVYGGRIASQHSKFLAQIEREIHSEVVNLLRKEDPSLAPGRMADFRLGEVQNFGNLIPASQQDGVPIYQVAAASPDQRDRAHAAFRQIARRIRERTRG